jgi:hypothetical protein
MSRDDEKSSVNDKVRAGMELIRALDTLERERGIPREMGFAAIERAIRLAIGKHFGDDVVEAWRLTTPLAQQMRAAYDGSPDQPATAIVFLRACAGAMATATVAEAVSLLDRADGFRISVPHPDDRRREFFPPEAGPATEPDRRRGE